MSIQDRDGNDVSGGGTGQGEGLDMRRSEGRGVGAQPAHRCLIAETWPVLPEFEATAGRLTRYLEQTRPGIPRIRAVQGTSAPAPAPGLRDGCGCGSRLGGRAAGRLLLVVRSGGVERPAGGSLASARWHSKRRCAQPASSCSASARSQLCSWASANRATASGTPPVAVPGHDLVVGSQRHRLALERNHIT